MPTCTPGSTTTTHYGFCKPADGETGWGTAYRTTMDAIDTAIFNTGIPRSYLAGLQTTPTQASTSVSIAVGVAMGNDQATSITLTSPLVKVLSSSWSVGSGNGGLYAATAIQAFQTYHLFVMIRTDTNVVDAYYDTSVNATNIPSPYTVYRRVASFTTASDKNIRTWSQSGDAFTVTVPILETTSTNPGTNAVTQALSAVPTGITPRVVMNAGNANGDANFYLSDLNTTDAAASQAVAPLANVGALAARITQQVVVRTNSSAQIRTRADVSNAGTQLLLVVTDWLDTRGKDS